MAWRDLRRAPTDMPEPAEPVVPTSRRTRRRVAAWVLGSFALFVAAGFFAVPLLLKSQLEQAVAAATGRTATVARVTFNPFTWRATLADFTLQDRTAGPPLLTVREVDADVSSASLWHRAPVLDALRIVEPRINLVRLPDGTYNVQDLIDRVLEDRPGPPPRVSLNNIEITGGAIAFDDQPHARRHAVADLAIAIPFISSLPVHVEVKVVPQLRATVNGTAFALDGTTTPFTERREAVLDVNLDALPLPAYVTYLPVKPNVKLVRGALTTRLQIVFRDGDASQRALRVTGDARVDDLAITRLDDAPLLAIERAALTLGVDAFARKVEVTSLAVTAPQVEVRRASTGAIEWAQPLYAAPAERSGAAPQPAAPATARPWSVAVRSASATGGVVRIADDAVAPSFRAELSDIALEAANLATTPGTRGTVAVKARSDLGATIALEAEFEPATLDAAGRAEIAQLRLAKIYPYYADALNLEVGSGTLDVAGNFVLATRDGKLQLTFAGGTATVADLRLALPGEREPLWRMPQLGLGEITFDLAARKVEIGEFASRGAVARVRREADGSFNWARLLKTTTTTGNEDEDTWTILVRRAQVARIAVDIDDRVPTPPVLLKVRELSGTMENFTNARGKRGALKLRAQVGDAGRVALNGAFATNPGAVDVALDASRLALAPLQPYLDGVVNVTVTRGTVAAKGRLSVGASEGAAAGAPQRVTFAGDVAVEDFVALDKPTTSDLAKWKSLSLTGVEFGSHPQKLAMGAVTLDDFYARVIVYDDASLNLARLLTPGAAPTPAPEAQPRAQPAVASTPEATARRDALPITIGRIEVTRGNVQFSDFFVQPNYSANLTDVAGTVSAMSAELAGDIAVAARVDRTAPVEIKGRLQPFAAELSLDLTGSARDIELPPLTPYAAKYAGYGIEKGKLSFDASYKVENRKLVASNKLVLDQLTFGARVDSPTATKLPVLLAVALLKDRHGVIDIELPIAGSLDDPQFSVGGLIVRVIVNLITKAVTAPFALLGAIAGGGAELSYVEFPPGEAVPAAAGEAKLASLAKALADRPALKLEIGGRAEPAADRAALENAAFDNALKAQKMKALVAQGAAPDSLAAITIAGEERGALLRAAYREAPIAERPRNLLGMLSDVPPEQMEAMLRKHTKPGDDALRLLANARAQAAKDALVARGVAADRLFILAPKLNAEGVKEGAPTRVDFALR